MAESFQNWVSNSRVNIKFYFSMCRASKKIELPLNLMVAVDLSNGQLTAPLSACEKDNVNKNNFNAILSEYSPKGNFTVKNSLADDGMSIYAPSHAFFAWKDSTGHFQYWETTSSNNKGEVPELSHDFYEKNFSPSYYTPFNGVRVEDIYSTLTYAISNIKPDLDAMYKKYPGDAFVSSWYYYEKAVNHKLTKNDARILLDLLQVDITSSDKRYALVQYFMSVNDHNRALEIFKTIGLKRCAEDCFQTGVDLGLKRYQYSQSLFDWYSGKLKSKFNNNIRSNVGDFFKGLALAVMGGGFIIISIIGSAILLIRKKKIKACITNQIDR